MSNQNLTNHPTFSANFIEKLSNTVADDSDNLPSEPTDKKRQTDEPWFSAASLSPIATRITDPRAQVIFVNEPWIQSTGMGMVDARGLGWLNRVEETMRLTLLERLLAPIEQGRQGFTLDYELFDGHGKGCLVREVSRPRFGTSGQFLGHFAAIVDLSDIAHTSSPPKLTDDYDPTLSAASAIVYDIAPPLTSALAYNHAALAELRLDQSVAATKAVAQLVLAKKHLTQSGDMLRRLREVLNKGQAYFNAAHLDDLIREAAHNVTQARIDEGVDLRLELPADPAPVMANPLQVLKVLSYLLGSALESVVGIVCPKISIQLDEDPSGLWRVCVRHNGPALHNQHEDTVFSSLHPMPHDNTGLGLAISQSIIRGHNGRLWYDRPSPGDRHGSLKGGAFTFVLPQHKQS
ncbi:MAG: hypothetical protein RJA87_1434 [Pseudomonadota bacterium]|jgi:hypothetical protein